MLIPNQRQSLIRIVAALVTDDAGRVLLVRKRGTLQFMQPGGKLHGSETPIGALKRELREELTCSMQPSDPVFLGSFTSPAAHEEGSIVEAALYRVKLAGPVVPAAEIEEILWLHPAPPHRVDLAPLARDKVLPLALNLIRGQHLRRRKSGVIDQGPAVIT